MSEQNGCTLRGSSHIRFYRALNFKFVILKRFIPGMKQYNMKTGQLFRSFFPGTRDSLTNCVEIPNTQYIAEPNAILESFKHLMDCIHNPDADPNVIHRSGILGVAESCKSTGMNTVNGVLAERHGTDSIRVLAPTGKIY